MLNNWELQYAALVAKIISYGELKKTRNGYTKSVFGEVLKVDTQDGFPILKGRKVYYKGVFGEVAAMLKNAQSAQEFRDKGCNYWDTFVDEQGKLNLDYGRVWRNFEGYNQLAVLRDTIKNNPNDRRMIITSWKPDNLDKLSLPCCHILYQWYVRDNNILDMTWYQRSVDTMIGLPSDIIFATVFNMLLANEQNMVSGKITFMLGDTHIYKEHFNNAQHYLNSVNSIANFDKVKVKLNSKANADNFEVDMLQLLNYKPIDTIKFKLMR